ncbi:MAG: hypothetical protein EXR09_00450 [Acetobacteraceae bacterium]|nr:hypothetical protein [Acetobacteraceae bacterium]
MGSSVGRDDVAHLAGAGAAAGLGAGRSDSAVAGAGAANGQPGQSGWIDNRHRRDRDCHHGQCRHDGCSCRQPANDDGFGGVLHRAAWPG